VHDNAPVSDEGGGALDNAGEGVVGAAVGFTRLELGAELAGQVADLAVLEGVGVTGLVARVVRVEVAAGGGAVASRVDRVDVDVERWGLLVGGLGKGYNGGGGG
jgi:hypothetical protein